MFLVAGCSPAFNWREYRFEAGNAQALLPCKPDVAQRDIPLDDGGAPIPLWMAGCQAGGATFAVSLVKMPASATPEQAARTLERWELATTAALKARAGAGSPTTVKGADAARLVVVQAQSGTGMANTPMSRSVYARKGTLLLMAQVLGEPDGSRDGPSALSAEAVDTFLNGLQL